MESDNKSTTKVQHKNILTLLHSTIYFQINHGPKRNIILKTKRKKKRKKTNKHREMNKNKNGIHQKQEKKKREHVYGIKMFTLEKRTRSQINLYSHLKKPEKAEK